MSTVRPLQRWAQEKKTDYFLKLIPPKSNVLEIGSASQWFKKAAQTIEGVRYTDIDLTPPADIVGDIRDWQTLGLQPESFDIIVAFEVVEHVDCFQVCETLLRPGGKLFITTPVPHWDWAMKILEIIGLNQKRSSPHSHLVYLKDVTFQGQKEIMIKCFLAQWAIFTKAQ